MDLCLSKFHSFRDSALYFSAEVEIPSSLVVNAVSEDGGTGSGGQGGRRGRTGPAFTEVVGKFHF